MDSTNNLHPNNTNGNTLQTSDQSAAFIESPLLTITSLQHRRSPKTETKYFLVSTPGGTGRPPPVSTPWINWHMGGLWVHRSERLALSHV